MALVTVEKIKEIESIPNAEKIEKIILLNSKETVAPIGQFKKEQYVCFLPNEVIVNKIFFNGLKRNRVRTRKIFGIQTDGIVLPLENLLTLEKNETFYSSKGLDLQAGATPSEKLEKVIEKYGSSDVKSCGNSLVVTSKGVVNLMRNSDFGIFAGTNYVRSGFPVGLDRLEETAEKYSATNAYPFNIYGIPKGTFIRVEINDCFATAITPDGKVLLPNKDYALSDKLSKEDHRIVKYLRMLTAELESYNIKVQAKLFGVIPDAIEYYENTFKDALIHDATFQVYGVVYKDNYYDPSAFVVEHIMKWFEKVPCYGTFNSFKSLNDWYNDNVSDELKKMATLGGKIEHTIDSAKNDIIKLIAIGNEIANINIKKNLSKEGIKKVFINCPDIYFSGIPIDIATISIQSKSFPVPYTNGLALKDSQAIGKYQKLFVPLFITRDLLKEHDLAK